MTIKLSNVLLQIAYVRFLHSVFPIQPHGLTSSKSESGNQAKRSIASYCMWQVPSVFPNYPHELIFSKCKDGNQLKRSIASYCTCQDSSVFPIQPH